MNTFSNMEINDLLDNRFRLDGDAKDGGVPHSAGCAGAAKHTPNYLAECFQRLFPTLGRMGLSTVVDEMARANSRCFGAIDGDMPSGAGMRHCEANSSRLPVRGETLNLAFFFELWKREFRFEGGIYDKFTFTDELKLAFKINPREFWEVLIRADRDLGNYLKDSIDLLKYRELPREISLNLRPNGTSPDDKTVRLLKEKLPFSRDNFTTPEIAKVCLQLFEVANPTDYDIRRLAEDLEKENGIRRLSGEPLAILPKKALDRLSTKCVLEFFKSKPLASAEASAMERGVYTVTEADILLASQQGSDAFWQSIIPDKKERENTLSARNYAGMENNARNFRQEERILVVTDKAIQEALQKNRKDVVLVQQMGTRVGISPSFIEDFMGKIYVCHSFYELKDLEIDYQTLKALKEMMEA